MPTPPCDRWCFPGADSSGELKSLPLTEPSPADVQALAERIERLLRKAGRYLEDQGGPAAEPEPDDSLAREAAAGDGLLFGPHDRTQASPRCA